MNDREFQERWSPIEARLRAVEEDYRAERIRKGGRPRPEGERLYRLEEDLSLACDLYIEAAAEHRDRMRQLFEWSYLLPRYLIQRIRVPADAGTSEAFQRALRGALAACSLENNKTDFRDVYVLLGEIWIEARRRGLDPRPQFSEAAIWSSEEGGRAGTPLREFLLRFHESAYFEAAVQPRLNSIDGRA